MLNQDLLKATHYPGRGFATSKRAFDVVVAVMALPTVGLVALMLLAINPISNRGPLLYFQQRMGRNCKPFTMVKFRSMSAEGTESDRGPCDPVEERRITPLGRVLRRTRLDELPQFLNVLAGDMSLIGPRPDYWDHAIHYLDTVPNYRERHTVRPGITGLAQVDGGYAEGIHATVEKTRFDMRYIMGLGLRMETYVLMRTIRVVFTGDGAR
ncbi:MAG: sugar transferase [Pseudomonadota bacterium]